MIEDSFRSWLNTLANSWRLPVSDAAVVLAPEEINNRVQNYPHLRQSLLAAPFSIQSFAAVARKCWVMGGHFDAIRFNRFTDNNTGAVEAIVSLVQTFPDEETKAVQRIDEFVEKAISLGFATPQKTADRAGAAQLASLILTSLFPARFADYRRSRWTKLAEQFRYSMPPRGATHGEWVVWAGAFASEIASTPTYREYWPSSSPRLSHPLWVVSGLCWEGVAPARPELDPIDPDSQSFPEGGEKRRLHLIRERSQAVVAQAKALGFERDPLLRCEACGFSFVERYGERGKGFIEAHHTLPVAQLTKGSRTRVEDLALLCSNCHRMIHSGDKTVGVEELRQGLGSGGEKIAEQGVPADRLRSG